MQYLPKLNAALPKEDVLNGLDRGTLTEHLWKDAIAGKHVTPRAAVVLYDVHEAKVDGKGDRVATMRVRLIAPIESHDGQRSIEQALFEYALSEHGAIFPHEVKRLMREAFANLPRTPEEQDVIDERERDTMSPADEVRRHLAVVHGIKDADLLTDDQANARHDLDHDGELPEPLAHKADWIGWSRADLEEAEFEADAVTVRFADGDPEAEDIASAPEVPDLFDDGQGDGEQGESGVIVSPIREIDPDRLGPPTEATFPGECSADSCAIEVGDIIRADGEGGWVREQCAA